MRARPKISVLIASENRLFRESLSGRIAQEKGFGTPSQAHHSDLAGRLRAVKPDLLLLDADALGPGPESLLARVRVEWPELRILVLGAAANDSTTARALRYGAAGLVGKNESLPTLFRAMLTVCSGEPWAGPKAIAQALSRLTRQKSRRPSSSLTSRERELLSLLGEGYRNKELAALLKIKEQTVKIHLHSLFRKLNVRTRVEAALRAVAQD